MEEKFESSFVVDFGNTVKTLEEVSTSSIVKGIQASGVHCSAWIKRLLTDEHAAPYIGDYHTLVKELLRRKNSAMTFSHLHEIHAVVSQKNVVTVSPDPSKNGKVANHQAKILDTKLFGGYICPASVQKIEERVLAQNVTEMALNAIKSEDLSKRADISYALAKELDIPVVNLTGRGFPAKPRKDVVLATAISASKNSNELANMIAILNTVVKVIPEEARAIPFKWNESGKTPIAVPRCDSVQALYRIIESYRQLRGSDNSHKASSTQNYYFGHGNMSFYRAAYVVLDILALGQSAGTKILEISTTDNVVNSYVLESLVGMGWLIRVVSNNMYPKRDKEKQGIFSYFAADSAVLRWCPMKETAPQRKEKLFVLNDMLPTMVSQSFFSYTKDDSIIPFSYVYINETLLNMPKFYKGCSLFPTSHAHNGQVIMIGKEVEKPMILSDYMVRVVKANVYKTLYVYTRQPYWITDPYGAPITFYMRHRQDVITDLDMSEESFKVEFEVIIQPAYDAPKMMNINLTGAYRDKQILMDQKDEIQRQLRKTDAAIKTESDENQKEKMKADRQSLLDQNKATFAQISQVSETIQVEQSKQERIDLGISQVDGDNLLGDINYDEE